MQAIEVREATRKLGGLITQIDDAYLGGERNGGKPERGFENKRPFVAAVSVDAKGHPGMAVLELVSGFTKEAMNAWFAQHLEPDTEVYSDGLGAFRAATDQGHAHTVIDAGGGRAATRAKGARWVNTVLSHVKRALDGTYSCDPLLQILRTLSGRSPVPVQSSLRTQRHAAAPAGRCGPLPAMVGTCAA